MTPSQEEREWRARMESKVDKLFSLVTQTQINCAAKSSCGDGITGREKVLLALMGCAMTANGILAGIAFG